MLPVAAILSLVLDYPPDLSTTAKNRGERRRPRLWESNSQESQREQLSVPSLGTHTGTFDCTLVL